MNYQYVFMTENNVDYIKILLLYFLLKFKYKETKLIILILRLNDKKNLNNDH